MRESDPIYVCLGIPSRHFFGRKPQVKPLDVFRAKYGDDYYICRFQEPGKIEAEVAEVGIPYMLKNILTTSQTGPPILPKGEFGTGFSSNSPEDSPSWFTKDDLAHYASKFDKTDLTGGLNYYRCLDYCMASIGFYASALVLFLGHTRQVDMKTVK